MTKNPPLLVSSLGALLEAWFVEIILMPKGYPTDSAHAPNVYRVTIRSTTAEDSYMVEDEDLGQALARAVAGDARKL